MWRFRSLFKQITIFIATLLIILNPVFFYLHIGVEHCNCVLFSVNRKINQFILSQACHENTLFFSCCNCTNYTHPIESKDSKSEKENGKTHNPNICSICQIFASINNSLWHSVLSLYNITLSLHLFVYSFDQQIARNFTFSNKYSRAPPTRC